MKLDLKFNPIVIEAIDSFALVNKSVKFVNNVSIKKKTLDKSMLDAFKNKESSLITFDIERIVNKDLD